MNQNMLPPMHHVSNREQITFSCNSCGACCRNVRDSIMLEPYDAFRLIRYLSDGASEQSPEELLLQYANIKPLSRGYSVFVLKTIRDSGVCTFLVNGRCVVYSARPRTCRMYPFFTVPDSSGMSLKWNRCTEQAHHFKRGHITAREWQRRYLPKEEAEMFLEEARTLPELGKLFAHIPETHLQVAEAQALAFSFLAYDFNARFLEQYKENMFF